ncbi:MAG: hypothetical protein WA057_00425 [Candidatus Magasanikiibacteriota bacterium]
MKKKFFIIGFCIILSQDNYSQVNSTNDDIVKATEFTVPSSGAFNLMGNSSTIVSRPGYTKDFSFGNFINDGKLLDNIAIDAQPFWILLFKNKNYQNYKKQTCFMRALSKVNISSGTTKKDDIRQFAYSGKFTFQKDPMMDSKYIDDIEKMTDAIGFNDTKIAMGVEINKIEDKMNSEKNSAKKDSLKNLLDLKTKAFSEFDKKVEETVIVVKKKLAADYIEKHWTDFVMDVGVGQIYNYNSPNIDSINLSTNGFGVWINPAKGFSLSNIDEGESNKIQIAALFKWVQINKKDDMYGGINVRYGTSKVNAFAEYIYEDNSNIVSNTFAFGANYKIDNKKIIEIGLRRKLDKDFNLMSFYPAVSISWALAKDILK